MKQRFNFVALHSIVACCLVGISTLTLFAQDGGRVEKHVVVYQQPGRFAGWPANHGAWSWGNELLVGFDVGYFSKSTDDHAIDYKKPAKHHVLARSLDGGETWRIEEPESLKPPRGVKVADIPVEGGDRDLTDCPGGIDFSNPDFIMTARMTSVDAGQSRFYYSLDRGKTWMGPYRIPNFGQPGTAARTDYLINGKHDLTMLLTAAKSNAKEGRVICVRTRDGGKTWQLQSFVGPEPQGREWAIMPSSVRLPGGRTLTAIRLNTGFIDLYSSDDDGKSWSLLSRPASNIGGNPPSMILLKDGRLAITYGYRRQPYGIRARISGNGGKSWGEEIVLRADGGNWDLGYPRTLLRPDGKLVTIYYYNLHVDSERFIGATIWDAGKSTAVRPKLVIPRLDRAPSLEAFLDMKPVGEVEGRMARVEGFIQRKPEDGKSASQVTEGYLGYDDKQLYVVFVCFDTKPKQLRARMTRRKEFWADDWVVVVLDTFDDQRRSYYLRSNPLGIQGDSFYSEGSGSGDSSGHFDYSFEMVWHTQGKLTNRGYVVWFALPFRSLRFSPDLQQTWGLILIRRIPRTDEESFWPRVTSREQGLLHQSARLEGITNVSRGRNLQFIPFSVFRSFRALDLRDPNRPMFVRERANVDAGIDAKVVFKDSLVLDIAVNPDFSHVESDEPQVTVNRRFEVFLPERRPFFLENSTYFRTPINLIFTRRIGDPHFGLRLSGKLGRYNLGALFADDRSPGQAVPPSDPSSSGKAYFGVLRASRDIFEQSSIGLIYTDRRFQSTFNRVGGIDGRFKLNKNWFATFQAVASSTKLLDGTWLAGPAYEADIRHEGRKVLTSVGYSDRSPGFRTLAGFDERADVRSVRNHVRYRFRPEGKRLIAWGPSTVNESTWDHEGTRLDWRSENDIRFEFKRQTMVGAAYSSFSERLRPKDFPVLLENRDYSGHYYGFFFNSSYFRWLTVDGFFRSGKQINFVPISGRAPELADATNGDFTISLRPMGPLLIDNTYIQQRFRVRRGGPSVFNNHIVRSKLNWQFNRQLSLRAIFQYTAVLANPRFTSLETSKNINGDFLITYLLHPGTAVYVGYNGNAQNIDLIPTSTGTRIIRQQHFINDNKQFFVKFSYLLRL